MHIIIYVNVYDVHVFVIFIVVAGINVSSGIYTYMYILWHYRCTQAVCHLQTPVEVAAKILEYIIFLPNMFEIIAKIIWLWPFRYHHRTLGFLLMECPFSQINYGNLWQISV